MIDAEVMRLRRLRNTALRARALAAALKSSASRRDSAISRSAVICWQIARTITGRLRAHPDLSYQRGPSESRNVYDRIRANILGSVARDRKRSLAMLADEVRGVARELDDARALTWSAELSDDFGRAQIHVRRLISDLGGSRQVAALRAARVPARGRGAIPQGERDVAGNWPYLAF
ncbi:MAG TPA: hypothetical protein VNV61_13605 [Steroidobacteraceae bacterium]|jgi:hypothetical protein|nr:hypothetical protein [Steroidobacteraceae bacterium]